jgi:hypothetical protein
LLFCLRVKSESESVTPDTAFRFNTRKDSKDLWLCFIPVAGGELAMVVYCFQKFSYRAIPRFSSVIIFLARGGNDAALGVLRCAYAGPPRACAPTTAAGVVPTNTCSATYWMVEGERSAGEVEGERAPAASRRVIRERSRNEQRNYYLISVGLK